MPWGPGEVPYRWARAVVLVIACTAASTGVLAVILLGLNNFGVRNDFLYELWPAYRVLHAGHLHAFISTAPSYVGAAVWRAPVALAVMACGGGWRITFLATSAPCFAVVSVFGIWFARRTGEDQISRRRTARTVAFVTVADPLVWYAGVLGHPEELVGAVLAIAAVLVAVDGRHRLAAVLLVLALLNKPGLAEVVPVVLVATNARYTRPALVVCMFVAILYAVYELTGLYYDVTIPQLTSGITAGGGFFPFQLLWWLGGSAWLSMHEHVLIVPACVLLCAGWWYRQAQASPGVNRRELEREILWLAAFIFLFRTAFDPWNTMYYSVPLLVCLLCLEAGRVPVMTVVASVLVVLVVPANRILPLSPDGQAALFAAVVIPTLAILAARAYRPSWCWPSLVHVASSEGAHDSPLVPSVPAVTGSVPGRPR